MFFKYGMNARQYGHHVAQNTTTAGLPLVTAGKSTGCPAKSVACQAGARSPCSTASAAPAAPKPIVAATKRTRVRKLIAPLRNGLPLIIERRRVEWFFDDFPGVDFLGADLLGPISSWSCRCGRWDLPSAAFR